MVIRISSLCIIIFIVVTASEIVRANSQDDADNRSDQMNPNNDAYWDSRGEDGRPDDWENRIESSHSYSQGDFDNRSNQLNPNNDAYWDSRGEDGRPDDWDVRIESSHSYSQGDFDNRSNQLNPNNDSYWSSRGYGEKPNGAKHNLANSASSRSNKKINNLEIYSKPNESFLYKHRRILLFGVIGGFVSLLSSKKV